MSDFITLANDLSLTDIFSVETEVKEPSSAVYEQPASAAPSGSDQPGTEVEEQVTKVRLSPEESGEALVAMIEGLSSPVFTALHYRKFKRAFTEEQKALIDAGNVKNPDKRSEEESTQIGRFERLEAEMKKRIDEVAFTEEEYRRLVKPAALMCKAHNLDIPPSLAFALVAMQIVSNRVVDLVAS